MTSDGFKSGFVAIVGPPNAGKSTLLNRLLGQKIAITSSKPQTTRNRLLGVMHHPGSQIVFLDTPGVHKAKKPLNVRIVEVALSTLAEVDLVLLLLDASQPDPEAEQLLASRLAGNSTPVILALNKIDRLKKPRLLQLMDRWGKRKLAEHIVPISAKTGEQVDRLVDLMQQALPEGPPYFPPDAVTDLSERFLAGELIREKAIRLTGQEIPYSVAVTVEQFRQGNDGKVHIHATLHVERPSQKGILIGKGGRKLVQIGRSARLAIERLLGCRVYLELFVRVQKNWSKDTKALRRFGYE